MSEAIKQPVSPEGIIQMQGVNKWYGQFHVLKDINLNVKQGERIVLCGPSGSGKSTTIRCLNRLEAWPLKAMCSRPWCSGFSVLVCRAIPFIWNTSST
ncbi:ATP-binding cassette domain-containing protein, partial [Corynebacterium diphtheriae]